MKDDSNRSLRRVNRKAGHHQLDRSAAYLLCELLDSKLFLDLADVLLHLLCLSDHLVHVGSGILISLR